MHCFCVLYRTCVTVAFCWLVSLLPFQVLTKNLRSAALAGQPSPPPESPCGVHRFAIPDAVIVIATVTVGFKRFLSLLLLFQVLTKNLRIAALAGQPLPPPRA